MRVLRFDSSAMIMTLCHDNTNANADAIQQGIRYGRDRRSINRQNPCQRVCTYHPRVVDSTGGRGRGPWLPPGELPRRDEMARLKRYVTHASPFHTHIPSHTCVLPVDVERAKCRRVFHRAPTNRCVNLLTFYPRVFGSLVAVFALLSPSPFLLP